MKRPARIATGILHAFASVGALPAGAFMILFPQGTALQTPLSMLKGAPFRDFFVPGIILFAVNGLGQASAALAEDTGCNTCASDWGLQRWLSASFSSMSRNDTSRRWPSKKWLAALSAWRRAPAYAAPHRRSHAIDLPVNREGSCRSLWNRQADHLFAVL